MEPGELGREFVGFKGGVVERGEVVAGRGETGHVISLCAEPDPRGSLSH